MGSCRGCCSVLLSLVEVEGVYVADVDCGCSAVMLKKEQIETQVDLAEETPIDPIMKSLDMVVQFNVEPCILVLGSLVVRREFYCKICRFLFWTEDRH